MLFDRGKFKPIQSTMGIFGGLPQNVSAGPVGLQLPTQRPQTSPPQASYSPPKQMSGQTGFNFPGLGNIETEGMGGWQKALLPILAGAAGFGQRMQR